MINKIHTTISINKILNDQEGHTLILVLIMLALGSIIIPVLAMAMTAGLQANRVLDNKTRELYSANAGIEDAIWQIKYDHLGTTFSSPNYDIFDYSTNWNYSLNPSTIGQVNNQNVNVTISNIWIPKGITAPDPADAKKVIEGINGNPPRLAVTSTMPAPANVSNIYFYETKISYNPPDLTSRQNIKVNKIGVWLPPGFSYYTDATHKSNLENSSAPYNKAPSSSDWSGNKVMTWDFTSSPVALTSFPGVGSSGSLDTSVTFFFSDDMKKGDPCRAVAWIETSGVSGTNATGVSGINYAWDADKKIYKITSSAGDSTIDAYSAKTDLRPMDIAVSGDYYATGQSLVQDTNGDPRYRELLLTQSSSSVSAIPDDAKVEGAYLYWSGWVQDKANGIFWDSCSVNSGSYTSLSKWDQSGTWVVDHNAATDNSYYDRYKAQGNGASLQIKDSIDLTGVTPSATIKWDLGVSTNGVTTIFDDAGTNPITTYWSTAASPCWAYSTNQYRAHTTSGTLVANDAKRYITHSEDLTSYTGAANVTLEWKWSSDSLNDATKGIDVEISSDGTNFTKIDGFTNTKPSETKGYILPPGYLTSTFKVRFKLVGLSYGASAYCYLDDIRIKANPNPDVLKLQISKNGGASWNNLGDYSTNGSYAYVLLPSSSYLTSNVKIKFLLSGFSDAGEYVTLDNIIISDDSIISHYDPNISFTIKNSSNVEHKQNLVAGIDPKDIVWPQIGDDTSSKVLSGGVTPDGYYYSCKKDVTDLIKEYTTGANTSANPPIYGTGNAMYTVSNVYSDIISYMNPGKLADSGYGGWSLVIIYSSPTTKGHQMFLYDKFRSVPNKDGSNPYVITEPINGFVVPEKIEGETNADDAAKLTIFVGEGDQKLTGDYVAFIDPSSGSEHKLWDGVTTDSNTSTSPNNAFNSKFLDQSTFAESSVSGVDVDTFHIKWGDNLLKTGDTSTEVKLSTNGDGYVLVYMILSFRSKTTTGGTMTYLIRD